MIRFPRAHLVLLTENELSKKGTGYKWRKWTRQRVRKKPQASQTGWKLIIILFKSFQDQLWFSWVSAVAFSSSFFLAVSFVLFKTPLKCLHEMKPLEKLWAQVFWRDSTYVVCVFFFFFFHCYINNWFEREIWCAAFTSLQLNCAQWLIFYRRQKRRRYLLSGLITFYFQTHFFSFFAIPYRFIMWRIVSKKN